MSETIVKTVSFDKVIDVLKAAGIGKGSLLVVHSSYAGLACTCLSEDEIIDRLLDLIGPEGTLAMPVIRKFKGEPKVENLLTESIDNKIFTYNVKKTAVISGILPYSLMQRPDAQISKFPLNPICAIGPLAGEMLAHNIDGEHPSPHGKNSSWKYCYNHNAYYIGLGVNLERHCTMVHVAEEAFDDWHWSEKEWYRIRKFTIIDENKNTTYKEVYERKPKWGMLHMAEIRMAYDLIKQNIIKVTKVDGEVEVGVSRAMEVVSFLRQRNKNGYPYYK